MSNITSHQVIINLVLMSYLSMNIVIHNLSRQLHSHFVNEIKKTVKNIVC